MKKMIFPLAALMLAVVCTAPASAAFRFDLDQSFNNFSDSRLEGQNRHYGVAFDLDNDFDIGFYIENANLQLNGDVGATPPNTTQLNYNAQAIRVTKKFMKYVEGGVDIGSVKLQQGPCTGFAVTPVLNQTAPLMGLVGTARYGAEIKDKVSVDLHFTLSYRMVNLNDVALVGAPAGEGTLDDLNSLMYGVGVGIRF